MKLISFKAPNTYLEGLDELVRVGVYSSRSEAIRIAIRDLLKKELDWGSGGVPASLLEVDLK
ncbi:MAG: ribbon-helix-helix domain-containing protein [Candidatus Hodarchaeales archaeon]